jgi:hypothetical protein
MDSVKIEAEDDAHSFIVRIWVGHLPPTWQGQVTHVPSGRHRSFRSLGAMTAFISPYLPEAADGWRTWRGWLRRWR